MPRLAVLSVLFAASSPCPDLNLIHYMLCRGGRVLSLLSIEKRSSENVPLLQTDTVSDDLLFIMVKIHMDYDKLV